MNVRPCTTFFITPHSAASVHGREIAYASPLKSTQKTISFFYDDKDRYTFSSVAAPGYGRVNGNRNYGPPAWSLLIVESFPFSYALVYMYTACVCMCVRGSRKCSGRTNATRNALAETAPFKFVSHSHSLLHIKRSVFRGLYNDESSCASK